MLLANLAIAWYFYDSARWFSADTQALNRAAGVAADYESIARLGWQSLQDMESAVRRGTPMDSKSLAAAAGAVRQTFARLELGLDSAEDPSGTATSRALLTELQATTEELFRTTQVVDAALRAGQSAIVEQELARLDSAGTASRFRGLVAAAIEERQRQLSELGATAVSQAGYVMRLLPLIMLTLVIGTALVAWRFSQRLAGSLEPLQAAAKALARGELQHRVPELREQEFRRLGDSFNDMARELDEKEQQLRESNVGLEATVGERTRALQESNEKLALVDEHRRKLLAEISHEFRTPLTVIRGESEIALRSKDASAADYEDAFRRIMDTADHATGLVEDLLFIVRADAGEPRLHMQELEALELLRAVCEEFRAKAAAKGLEIHFEGDTEHATLHGDPRRLRQVFAILLDNAQRYSNEGGAIHMHAAAVPEGLMVTVTDEGIGLDETEAAQAFERFFRGRKAQSHAHEGTGLGLPVARAIVEAHGGTIKLAPRETKGAIATVMLPLKDSLRVVA